MRIIWLILLTALLYAASVTSYNTTNTLLSRYVSLNTTGFESLKGFNFDIQGNAINRSADLCKHKGCFEFDANLGSYLNGTDVNYQFKNYTLALWIFVNSSIAGNSRIYGKDRPGGDTFGDFYFAWSSGSATLNGGNASCVIDLTVPTSTNTWHLLSASGGHDGTSFYLDGALDSTDCGVILNASTSDFILGGTRTDDPKFLGKQDEFMVWDRQLEAIEHAELYNVGIGNFYPFYNDSNNINITIGSVNFTSSGGQACGYDGSSDTICGPALDSTPTFTFKTKGVATCKLWNTTANYSTLQAQGVADCSTTTTNNHTCTWGGNIIQGNNQFFASCRYGAIEMNTFASSNIWNYTFGHSFYLDGLNQSRTYEYETTVALASAFDKITIYDDTNRYVNVSPHFSYFIDLLRLAVPDYNTVVNGQMFNISLDNRTELYSAVANVFGGGTSPVDLTLYYRNNYSTNATIVFPGTLYTSGLLTQNAFIFNGTKYTTLNLSTTSAGVKTIHVNYSTMGNLTNRTGNFNLTLTGYSLDAGNQFSITNRFHSGTNTTNVSYAGTFHPVGSFAGNQSYESFSNNETYSLWGWNNGEYKINANSCNQAEIGGDDTCLRRAGTLANVGDTVYSTRLDYSQVNRMNLQFSLETRCIADVRLEFTDLTNTQTIQRTYQDDCPSSPGNIADSFCNMTMERNGTVWTASSTTSPTSSISCSSGTIDTSSLNSPYYLRMRSLSGSDSGPVQHFFTLTLKELAIGGVYLNRSNISFNGYNAYGVTPLQGNFTTHIINQTPNAIARVTVDYTSFVPSGTSVQMFLSNDGAKTFETATDNEAHLFSSAGNQLVARFQLNSSSNQSSPIVYGYTASVTPAALSGISLDVGADGNADFILNQSLNGSSTPYNLSINTSIFDNYINRTRTTSTLLIPITLNFFSGGTLQISNMNYSNYINPISFNISHIQDANSMHIIPIFTTGTSVDFREFKFDFRGSKNITVSTFFTNGTNVENRTIRVVYSPFDIFFPSGQLYWEIFPTSRVQNDIQPFGQNVTHGIWRFNSSKYYDGGMDIYARYNESINSCVGNMTFTGNDFSLTRNVSIQSLNITNLTTAPQLLISNFNPLEFPLLCYQENASQTNFCGAISGNGYAQDAGWTNPQRVYDNNYSTFGTPTGISPLRIFMNYTVPNDAKDYSWQVKDSCGTANLTPTLSCFNSSGDGDWRYFYVESSPTTGIITWHCHGTNSLNKAYNDTTLRTCDIGDSSTYEEALFWNIAPQNVSYAQTWTYTDINCSTQNASVIIPYFCFQSICSDCVRTTDGDDECAFLQ